MNATSTRPAFFLRKVPSYLLVAIALAASVVTYYLNTALNRKPPSEIVHQPAANMNQIRENSSRLTHPLLLADLNDESATLAPLKNDIQYYINQLKSTQKVNDVSVYFRKLNDGSWFSINAGQVYNPASLIKVAYLVSYLKDADRNPGLLDKKIFFRQHYSQGNNPNIGTFRLKENTHYTIRDLLYAMIAHSDNDATALLTENANTHTFKQVFLDLKIPVPDMRAEYFINPVDMSKFFRVLYNASYVSKEASEFALDLLTMSTFKDGIVAGNETNTVIAHKFGERIIVNTAQLHEFGIVYYKDQPYLLGIMTSGSNLQDLAAVIRQISSTVNSHYNGSAGS